MPDVRFQVVSDFMPAGDQPAAISSLSEGIRRGDRFQTLLGITGSGKSATIAWTIEQVQKPTLVIAPNKSLAAQLANELRGFFPNNRVEYFVSYYDYYQPEAYLPSSDTYIEKDSSVNDEIDRLRHSATRSLLTRRDVIVVASVSCIYGLGDPTEYRDHSLIISKGEEIDQRAALKKLVELQYDPHPSIRGGDDGDDPRAHGEHVGGGLLAPESFIPRIPRIAIVFQMELMVRGVEMPCIALGRHDGSLLDGWVMACNIVASPMSPSMASVPCSATG